MAQQNLQHLVIPILQTLYNAPDSTSHHIYMSLIVLLILSEDEGFNKSIHQIVSFSPEYFTVLKYKCLFVILDAKECGVVH